MPKIVGAQDYRHEPLFRYVPPQKEKIDKCIEFLRGHYGSEFVEPVIDYVRNYIYWKIGQKELFFTFSKKDKIGYIKVWTNLSVSDGDCLEDEFGDIQNDFDYDKLFDWLESLEEGLN